MMRRVGRSRSRGHEEALDDDEFRSRDAARFERIVARSPSRERSPIDRAASEDHMQTYHRALFEALSIGDVVLPELAPVAPKLAHAEYLLPMATNVRGDSRTQPLLASPPVAARVREALRRDRVLLRRPLPRTTPVEDKPDPLEFLDQLAPLPVKVAKPRRPQLHRNAVSDSGNAEPSLRVQAIRRSHQAMLARELAARPLLDATPRRASEPLLRYNLPDSVPLPPTPQEAPEPTRGRRREMLPPQMPPPQSPLPPPPLPEKSALRSASPGVQRRVSFARTPSGRSGSVPATSRAQESVPNDVRQRPSARDFYLEMAQLDWNIADDLQLL